MKTIIIAIEDDYFDEALVRGLDEFLAEECNSNAVYYITTEAMAQQTLETLNKVAESFSDSIAMILDKYKEVENGKDS